MISSKTEIHGLIWDNIITREQFFLFLRKKIMNQVKKSTTLFFYWFSWVISLLSSIVLLRFDVWDWFNNFFKGEIHDPFLFLLGMLIAITGSILALFRKIPGGWLMLLGAITMILSLSLHGGMRNFSQMVVYGLPYFIPGIVFIIARE